LNRKIGPIGFVHKLELHYLTSGASKYKFVMADCLNVQVAVNFQKRIIFMYCSDGVGARSKDKNLVSEKLSYV
jgi:hypothetical protein